MNLPLIKTTDSSELIVKISKAMILHSGEPFATSRQIAKEYGIKHSNLMRLIRDLKSFNELIKGLKIRPLIYQYRNQEFDYFEVDEEVFLLVVGRIRTKKAETSTMNFIKAFRMLLIENVAIKATIAANKANDKLKPIRERGKITRTTLTDAIKAFCAYAVEMRGKSYSKKNGEPKKCPYYVHFTNLSYKKLGLSKPPVDVDRRDVFFIDDIERLEALEQKIADSIINAIDTGDDYHELYKQVKMEVHNV